MDTGEQKPKGEKGRSGKQSFSCAECRRLKLKCTRVWPCSSCEKRGCAQICPKGEMRTGKGKRLILANTEELHHRISQLEIALAQAHAKTTPNAHPLLSSSLLYTPRDPKIRGTDNLAVRQEEEDIIEGGLGTLTISNQGEARFVGSFAGSEYLRDGETDTSERHADRSITTNGLTTPPMSGRGNWTGGVMGGDDDMTSDILGSFILGGSSSQDIEILRAQLLHWETEGQALAISYWDNVNWMYQILPRKMFDDNYLRNAYGNTTPANPHKLACVFFLLAVGAMFDLNRQPFHQRAKHLFELGRACLSAVSLERSSPATIQALHFYGTYILNDKQGNGAEAFWPILGTAVKIAQSLGLHRDGAAFGLSPYEVEERRVVWWELVTYDRLQALCFGRPCATTNRSSDTQFPGTVAGIFEDADDYHRTKYQLIKMMERIIEIQTQTSPVSIQQVSALDKEIKEFRHSVPEGLMPRVPIHSLPFDKKYHPHLVIHRLSIRLLVAQSRLLLNRPAFAHALRDNPSDPSQGRFSESFVGLYESAQEIVQLVKQLVLYHPSLIARWWFFWFHAFTASVCLAAIAIHAPSSAFASPAFHGMTIVCDISAAARPGCRAKKGLPILLRLRKRAITALTAVGHAPTSSVDISQPHSTNEEDDLSHLHTSVMLRRVGESPRSNQPNLRFVSQVSGEGITTAEFPANGIDYPEEGDDSSPRSFLSFATSTTLAEPMYYDQNVGMTTPLAQPFNPEGAVPPPPPPLHPAPYPEREPTVHHQPSRQPLLRSHTIATVPAPMPSHNFPTPFSNVTQGHTPARVSFTMPSTNDMEHPAHQDQFVMYETPVSVSTSGSANEFISQWHPPTTDTSPMTDRSPFQSTQITDTSIDWIYNMDLDISMALGLGGLDRSNMRNQPHSIVDTAHERLGHENGVNVDVTGDGGGGATEGEFDFEMFVNQLGGSDVGYV